MKIKAHIIFDNTKKSIRIRSLINHLIKSSKLQNAKFIIVIGGDGFMLQTLKKFHRFKKPFYGVNSGNYGFLMIVLLPLTTLTDAACLL